MRMWPVTVRRWADLRSSLPRDTVETYDEILQVGGKVMAEEVGKILDRLGAQTDEPVLEGDNGWQFNVNYGGRRMVGQATELGHFVILLDDRPYLGWFRKRPNTAYWDLLTKLAEELDRDPRFWDIAWHADDKRMPACGIRAARPVGEHPPLNIDFGYSGLRQDP